MDKATRYSLEQGWARSEELKVAHCEFLARHELAAGIPSWRALVGKVIHLGLRGSIISFHPDDNGEMKPFHIFRGGRVDGKLLAVESSGLWIGSSINEATPYWTFISFSNITSACLQRPADA